MNAQTQSHRSAPWLIFLPVGSLWVMLRSCKRPDVMYSLCVSYKFHQPLHMSSDDLYTESAQPAVAHNAFAFTLPNMPYQTHQAVKGRFCVQSAPCICFRSVLRTTEEAKKTFKWCATRDRFMMRNEGDVKQTGHYALQSPQHPQISLCFCFSPGNMSVKRGLNYFAGYLASCSLHGMF